MTSGILYSHPIPEHLKEYQVSVPEDEHGGVIIKRFGIDAEAASGYNLGYMISQVRDRCYVGTYTGLWKGERKANNLWMSDTPDEIRGHLGFIRRARGHVLVTGLGLGMVIQALLRKPEVDSVTVVEIDPAVIRLVAPHYIAMAKTHRVDLAVVHADAYEWKPTKGTRFDCAWHDIWRTRSTDNLADMARMVRHYQPYVKAGGQDCWSRDELRSLKRRGW